MKSNYALRYHNGGFLLGRGPNGSNTVRNCVATNVEGAGFLWYDGGEAVWVAEDSVAHNTFGSGIRVWQNNSLAHTISRFVCYHNDEWGIDHGAYGNSYHYEGGNFVGNRSGAIALRAVSSQDDNGRPLSFSDLYLDAAGTTYAMTLPDGTAVRAARPTLVQRCEFRNAERAALYWYGEGNNAIGRLARLEGRAEHAHRARRRPPGSHGDRAARPTWHIRSGVERRCTTAVASCPLCSEMPSAFQAQMSLASR
jgi:hypothetical protein